MDRLNVNAIRSTRTVRIPRREQDGDKDLKTLIDERNDVSILKFLELKSLNKNEDFKVI